MVLVLMLAAALQDPTPGGRIAIEPEVCVAAVAAEGEVSLNDEADCFVGWLYGPGVLDSLAPFDRDAERVFSRSMIDAIGRARSMGREDGNHEALDADPLCDCQDPGGLILVSAVTRNIDASHATSVVRYTFYPLYDYPAAQMRPEDVRENTLVLVKEDQGWRVDDIQQAGWSFREALAR